MATDVEAVVYLMLVNREWDGSKSRSLQLFVGRQPGHRAPIELNNEQKLKLTL